MKKIIFILIGLAMVFSIVSANSNFDDIFNAKTAKYSGISSERVSHSVKIKNGIASDKNGNFKYAIFNILGYHGRFIFGIKQYIESDQIKLFYGTPSSKISEKSGIPNFEVKRNYFERLKKKNNIYIIFKENSKTASALIKFFPEDE